MILDLKSAEEVRYYINRASYMTNEECVHWADWPNCENELFHLRNLVREEIEPFVALCELIGTTLMNKTENRLDIKPMCVPFIVRAVKNVKSRERN